jgi:hypothetical protein
MFLSLETAMISVPNGIHQTSASSATPTLDPRISIADPRWYSSVPFRRWRNPLLEVTVDGIMVKAPSMKKPLRTNVENLSKLLTALPRTDWPLGRVVVIAGPSIGPGDTEWWKAVDRNLARTIEVVTALSVVPYGAAL